jgi:eukaryotic-like serine/threonine-protein kinase
MKTQLLEWLRANNLRSVLLHASIALGVILLLGILYFFIYLPNATNHGESITVPDLYGMKVEELDTFLLEHELRFEVDDSAYSADFPPFTVLRQFPKAGASVKENRMIYVSVNRVAPPTVPLPELVDRSRINAEVVLKSNELKRGRIILEPSPFLNLVKEMRYKGRKIEAGTRVPKGSSIDLVVGDGNGPADFVIEDLVGDSYQQALFLLAGWNNHLGRVEIPEDVDTTGIEPFVFRQYPMPGDSVRVGDPVDLWIAPKGYTPPDETENEDEENN